MHTADDLVSDRIQDKIRVRTPLILDTSRRTPAITPRYGTALTKEAVSFNRLRDISSAPIFASASGDSRISRGTGRSRFLIAP